MDGGQKKKSGFWCAWVRFTVVRAKGIALGREANLDRFIGRSENHLRLERICGLSIRSGNQHGISKASEENEHTDLIFSEAGGAKRSSGLIFVDSPGRAFRLYSLQLRLIRATFRSACFASYVYTAVVLIYGFLGWRAARCTSEATATDD